MKGNGAILIRNMDAMTKEAGSSIMARVRVVARKPLKQSSSMTLWKKRSLEACPYFARPAELEEVRDAKCPSRGCLHGSLQNGHLDTQLN